MATIKARILKGIGGFYYVRPVDSLSLLETKPRGILRHKKVTPTVGDWVDVTIDGENSVIERIYPRQNIFVRPPVANVDVALVMFAATNPDPNLMLLDKLLVASEEKDVQAIICITKTDLATVEQLDELKEVYQRTPYKIVWIDNTVEGDLSELEEILRGKTAFMAGPSGVGKSTLANRLCQPDAMVTGGLSEKLGRGKHTTRHVELLDLSCGGYLLDTPGFSSLGIDESVDAENLAYLFPEFSQGGCRFNTCTHRQEPKCAVKDQVEAGTVHPMRYAHYLELYAQLEKKESWKK